MSCIVQSEHSLALLVTVKGTTLGVEILEKFGRVLKKAAVNTQQASEFDFTMTLPLFPGRHTIFGLGNAMTTPEMAKGQKEWKECQVDIIVLN